jgi:FMN phosphatase YigB (HAD superfamily)
MAVLYSTYVNMVKAIIFDLDMCILDTRTLGEHILDSVLAPLHESSMPEATQREIDRTLWTTSLEDCVELFKIPSAVAEKMRSAHRELVVSDDVKTFGDEDTLLDLPVYRILVTSGYREWQIRKIEKLGVARLFDEIIIDTIDDLATRKGKRVIFAELLARHGWEPQEVLVVGDNPHSELKAARALGIPTAQTLRPTVLKDPLADYHIESLNELHTILSSKVA